VTDRVVVVTGATSGIGLASALRLSAQGDHLLLLARDESALARAADRCSEAGAPSVDTLAGDVVAQVDVDRLVQRALNAHGRLDAVVHSATSMAYGTIEDLPQPIFDTVVAVAIHGTANIARAALPVFRGQSHGTLVIVNSLLGSVTVPNMGAYAAAKWGQRAVARTLQQEVRGVADVHVCIVSPGSTNTPIYEQAANYTPYGARPPFPVVQPEHTAKVIADLLDHPRHHVSIRVGPTNPVIVAGFRLLPLVYDRIVNPLYRLMAASGRRDGPTDGNVLAPHAVDDRLHGRWPSD
jgi:NAD(P)-dependent dehydrogenase (short-subunit alcohol dehydrogenase family)